MALFSLRKTHLRMVRPTVYSAAPAPGAGVPAMHAQTVLISSRRALGVFGFVAAIAAGSASGNYLPGAFGASET